MLIDRESFCQTLLLASLTLVLAPLPLLTALASPSQSEGPLLILSAPWADTEHHIAAAGGRVIGPERAPFGVFAASDDPNFAEILKARGLWSVQSSTLSRIFCGVPS